MRRETDVEMRKRINNMWRWQKAGVKASKTEMRPPDRQEAKEGARNSWP